MSHSTLTTVEPVQLPAATARGWVVGANGSVEHAGLLGRRLLRRRALERRNVQDGPPLHSSRYCLTRCATATACEDDAAVVLGKQGGDERGLGRGPVGRSLNRRVPGRLRYPTHAMNATPAIMMIKT